MKKYFIGFLIGLTLIITWFILTKGKTVHATLINKKYNVDITVSQVPLSKKSKDTINVYPVKTDWTYDAEPGEDGEKVYSAVIK